MFISEKKDEKLCDSKEDEPAPTSPSNLKKSLSTSGDKDLNGTSVAAKDLNKDKEDEDTKGESDDKDKNKQEKTEEEEENIEEGTSLSDIQKINDNINKNRVENLQILYRVRTFKAFFFIL